MFGPAVVHCKTAGRPSRTVCRDRVVAARVRSEGIRGAYGNCGWFIAGRMNLSVDFCAVLAPSIVAGGRHDHNSGIRHAADRLT